MSEDRKQAFRITLESPYSSFVQAFNSQMSAVLDLWVSRLTGELLPEGAKIPGEPTEVIRAPALGGDAGDNEAWDTPSDFSVDEAEDSFLTSRIVKLDMQQQDRSPETIYYRLHNCHLDQLTLKFVSMISVKGSQEESLLQKLVRIFVVLAVCTCMILASIFRITVPYRLAAHRDRPLTSLVPLTFASGSTTEAWWAIQSTHQFAPVRSCKCEHSARTKDSAGPLQYRSKRSRNTS